MAKIKIRTKNCPSCNKENFIEVEKEDYRKYQQGKLVQDCFPYLSNTERESLITGYCDVCWDNIFKGKD